jgi:hypothetical protein
MDDILRQLKKNWFLGICILISAFIISKGPLADNFDYLNNLSYPSEDLNPNKNNPPPETQKEKEKDIEESTAPIHRTDK